MHDPDFEPAGVIYSSVEEIDQRLVAWQSRAFVAETIAAALAMVARKKPSPLGFSEPRRGPMGRGPDPAQRPTSGAGRPHRSALERQP